MLRLKCNVWVKEISRRKCRSDRDQTCVKIVSLGKERSDLKDICIKTKIRLTLCIDGLLRISRKTRVSCNSSIVRDLQPILYNSCITSYRRLDIVNFKTTTYTQMCSNRLSIFVYLPMKICVWCRLRSALKFPQFVLGPQCAIF